MDEPREVEQSTEVPTLPPETVPPLPKPVPGRDEAEETGTVENDEIEELIRPTPRPPTDKTKPPVPPPTPPVKVQVMTGEPAPWLWWVTLGLCCAAIGVGVVYVLKARQREARDSSPGSSTPGVPSQQSA